MFLARTITRLLPKALRQRNRQMPYRLVAAFGDHESYTAAQVRRVLHNMHLGRESERFALAIACSEADYLDARPGETANHRQMLRHELAQRFNLPDLPQTTVLPARARPSLGTAPC